MRDTFALDDKGNEVPNYIGYETGEVYHCRHPGCHALVRFHKGPQSHEIFAYALPGQFHDHSLEGDHTVLIARKPVSSLIKRILSEKQDGTDNPKVTKRNKHNPHPGKVEEKDYITKNRNITNLHEIYRSGLCEKKGVCYIKIDGETIGDYFTSFVDRHYLFESVFDPSKNKASILSGGHIIELVPHRIYSTTMDAFLSDTVTVNKIEYKAYINIHLTFQSPALLRSIQKLCMPGSIVNRLFLVCCNFEQIQSVIFGNGNTLRARYSGLIHSEQQICAGPVMNKQSTS